MHSTEAVFNQFKNEGINLFTGVPDSLLKDFCAYVTDHTTAAEHVITANEGNAIALAAGHYLGSGNPALVYMQNSGIGNAVNPLLSLADKAVYSLPMVLMVGWRGEPGVKDEPQHVKQGQVMTELLDAMDIAYYKVDNNTPNINKVISSAVQQTRENQAPVVLLISKGAFQPYKLLNESKTNFTMSREKAIQHVVDSLSDTDIVVSTTGMTSRELYEYRASKGQGHGNDFLTVGAMGHTGSIALGIASTQPLRKVICIDGDGSVIMHMGSLGIIGSTKIPNLLHIVINNGAHDSVGGQPTVGFEMNLSQIAEACGYPKVMSVSSADSLKEALEELSLTKELSFLEILVNKGSRADLGRPKSTPVENKEALMMLLGLSNV